ncbi:hypothetical protein GO300_03829 [Ralstonia solanacearum]|nr:hypothetical protein [Ralstonia solanacearum]
MCAVKKIVRVAQTNAKPDFLELDLEGALTEALVRARSLASEAGFVLGQVLDADGKVLATVGPGGAVRLA